jgi:hypothetical protein
MELRICILQSCTAVYPAMHPFCNGIMSCCRLAKCRTLFVGRSAGVSPVQGFIIKTTPVSFFTPGVFPLETWFSSLYASKTLALRPYSEKVCSIIRLVIKAQCRFRFQLPRPH